MLKKIAASLGFIACCYFFSGCGGESISYDPVASCFEFEKVLCNKSTECGVDPSVEYCLENLLITNCSEMTYVDSDRYLTCLDDFESLTCDEYPTITPVPPTCVALFH